MPRRPASDRHRVAKQCAFVAAAAAIGWTAALALLWAAIETEHFSFDSGAF